MTPLSAPATVEAPPVVLAPAPTPWIPSAIDRPHYALAKRVLDVVVALPLVVLSIPVIAVTALLIARDSPGPVIFRQRRVGRGGRLFTFYKFRTMWVDARERFPELYAYDYSEHELQTMFFKLPHDPRLTKVGSWLRRTSLDELPNLVNVLRGDLSLVGPRPDIPEMVKFYKPHQLAKLTVKPGLTGAAQVNGRNILKFQETLTVDVDYVRRRSLLLDVQILFQTVRAVVGRVGAL
jgi:lipopolysaccharide/colanic/teichoic acid biosynthesis glycosyltransferase